MPFLNGSKAGVFRTMDNVNTMPEKMKNTSLYKYFLKPLERLLMLMISNRVKKIFFGNSIRISNCSKHYNFLFFEHSISISNGFQDLLFFLKT